MIVEDAWKEVKHLYLGGNRSIQEEPFNSITHHEWGLRGFSMNMNYLSGYSKNKKYTVGQKHLGTNAVDYQK